MSLASDLLRKYTTNAEEKKRARVLKGKSVKQPTAPVVTKATPTAAHMARIPGVRRLRGRWRAYVFVERRELMLGDFNTIQPALTQVEFFRYWQSQGWDPYEIPR